MNDTTTAIGKIATDEAIATLRAAPADLLALQKQASAEHEAARGWKPSPAERDQYTPARLQAEQTRRRGDVADRVKQQLDAIEQKLQQGAQAVAQYAAGAGQPTKSDAAAETREDRVWNNKLRPLLDANRGAARIIDEASSLDEVRALQRELPGWLMVRKQQSAQGNTGDKLRQAMSGAKVVGAANPEDSGADDPAPFLTMLNHKLAELLPAAEGTRLRAALDAEALTVGVRTRIDSLRRQYGTGGNAAAADLRAAFAARGADQAAKVRRGAPAA